MSGVILQLREQGEVWKREGKLRSNMKDNYAHALWVDASLDDEWKSTPLNALKIHSYFDTINWREVGVSGDLDYRILQQLTHTIIPADEAVMHVAPSTIYTEEDLFSSLVMLAAIDSHVEDFCNTAWMSVSDDGEPFKRHREWMEVVFAELYHIANETLNTPDVIPNTPVHQVVMSYKEILDEITSFGEETRRQRLRKIICVNMIVDHEMTNVFNIHVINEGWKRDGYLSEELLSCTALVGHVNRHIAHLHTAALHKMKGEIIACKESRDGEPDLPLDVLQFLVKVRQDKNGAGKLLLMDYGIDATVTEEISIHSMMQIPHSGAKRVHSVSSNAVMGGVKPHASTMEDIEIASLPEAPVALSASVSNTQVQKKTRLLEHMETPLAFAAMQQDVRSDADHAQVDTRARIRDLSVHDRFVAFIDRFNIQLVDVEKLHHVYSAAIQPAVHETHVLAMSNTQTIMEFISSVTTFGWQCLLGKVRVVPEIAGVGHQNDAPEIQHIYHMTRDVYIMMVKLQKSKDNPLQYELTYLLVKLTALFATFDKKKIEANYESFAGLLLLGFMLSTPSEEQVATVIQRLKESKDKFSTRASTVRSVLDKYVLRQ